jgi:hypothetical protein
MNYSLLIIEDSKVDGDGSKVDGGGRDGDRARWRWLRGHFPVPAGCWNRDFCPLKFVFDDGGAAELFWKFFADSLRVFYPEASYRQRGIVRGLPGAPHT